MSHLTKLNLDVPIESLVADIPVLGTPQPQGDVMWWKVDVAPATTPIPATGAVVVKGENGGNTHTLLPGGFFDYRTTWEDSLQIGILTVPDGAEVFMHHPEHGYAGIAPGTYRVGRQREYAAEWRMVAD